MHRNDPRSDFFSPLAVELFRGYCAATVDAPAMLWLRSVHLCAVERMGGDGKHSSGYRAPAGVLVVCVLFPSVCEAPKKKFGYLQL